MAVPLAVVSVKALGWATFLSLKQSLRGEREQDTLWSRAWPCEMRQKSRKKNPNDGKRCKKTAEIETHKKTKLSGQLQSSESLQRPVPCAGSGWNFHLLTSARLTFSYHGPFGVGSKGQKLFSISLLLAHSHSAFPINYKSFFFFKKSSLGDWVWKWDIMTIQWSRSSEWCRTMGSGRQENAQQPLRKGQLLEKWCLWVAECQDSSAEGCFPKNRQESSNALDTSWMSWKASYTECMLLIFLFDKKMQSTDCFS